MPSVTEHENKIQSNLNVIDQLESLDNPPYDWIVTIIFYVSVHLIEKKLAPYNKHNEDHKERFNCVNSFFDKIKVNYETLYLESQNSRYNCTPMTAGKVTMAKSNLNEIQKFFSK